MNRKLWALYAGVAILTTAAVAQDKGSLGVEVNGMPVVEQSAKSKEEPKATTREACLSHCMASESRCSTDVRRARSDCSRNAAAGGRSPYGSRPGGTTTQRDPYNPSRQDLTYFCSYFEHPNRQCGSDVYSRGCQQRMSQRYGLCIDQMNNIADLRYDCYKTERDAQNFCRDELRDCKASCQ